MTFTTHAAKLRLFPRTLAAVLILCGQFHAGSATAESFRIETPHPQATEAGRRILEAGGTAADAAIAAYTILSLVMPQSASIAGGGLALHYDSASGKLDVFDALETAPEQAGQYLFTGKSGEPLGKEEASVGGRATGVPGVASLFGILHYKFGRVVWADLMTPALNLSERGFAISESLADAIASDRSAIGKYNEGRQYFLTAFGNPRKAGEELRNPAYAELMRGFIAHGYDFLYSDDVAREMLMAVRERAYDNRGLMTVEDVSGYMAVHRDPLCIAYRSRTICSTGAPSASGAWLIETLRLLSGYDLQKMSRNSPEAWNIIARAAKAAWEERSLHAGDPETSSADGVELDPDPAYGREIGVSILAVDSRGNALSLMAGIHRPFGSRVFVDGMLLNSALSNFHFMHTGANDRPVLNSVEGGRRPRSEMAPVMVLDKYGRPELLIGAPGSSRNAARLLQRIISYIDWKVPASELASLPDIAVLDDIEAAPEIGSLARELEKLGHTVRSTTFPDDILVVETDK